MRFFTPSSSSFVPQLIEIQQESFSKFINQGIVKELSKRTPISHPTSHLKLIFYPKLFHLSPPQCTVKEALRRGRSYSCKLYVPGQLTNSSRKEIYFKWILFGDLPLMTERGHFVLNGSPRVIINQLARSPGIYYQQRIGPDGEKKFHADLIPQRGAWLRLEVEKTGYMWARMKRASKIPLLSFLQAFGLEYDKICNTLPFQEIGLLESTSLLLNPEEPLKKVSLALNNETQSNSGKRREREREEGTEEGDAKVGYQFIFRKFLNPKTYDLGEVGRDRLNSKLRLSFNQNQTTITPQDVLFATDYLLKCRYGVASLDDIDHLKNRRIRASGELLQNQFHTGLIRLEKVVREKMNIAATLSSLLSSNRHTVLLAVQGLVTTKPLNGALREFFGSSPLSQYMDQTNPLAEITHKRRITSVGPGGVSRETAGMAIRGIHSTYYGRICPIETPEGKQAGLVNSITTYARVNPHGFIETPYYKVLRGQAQRSTSMTFLSAEEEERKEVNLAPGDFKLSSFNFLPTGVIPVQKRGQMEKGLEKEVDYMAISPIQMISVATSLIPFLEHDDANRALMGSNMQRQAVPLVKPEPPLIGTGLEAQVVADSGHGLQAKNSSFVEYVSGDCLILRESFEPFMPKMSTSYGRQGVKNRRNMPFLILLLLFVSFYRRKKEEGEGTSPSSSFSLQSKITKNLEKFSVLALLAFRKACVDFPEIDLVEHNVLQDARTPTTPPFFPQNVKDRTEPSSKVKDQNCWGQSRQVRITNLPSEALFQSVTSSEGDKTSSKTYSICKDLFQLHSCKPSPTHLNEESVKVVKMLERHLLISFYTKKEESGRNKHLHQIKGVLFLSFFLSFFPIKRDQKGHVSSVLDTLSATRCRVVLSDFVSKEKIELLLGQKKKDKADRGHRVGTPCKEDVRDARGRKEMDRLKIKRNWTASQSSNILEETDRFDDRYKKRFLGYTKCVPSFLFHFAGKDVRTKFVFDPFLIKKGVPSDQQGRSSPLSFCADILSTRWKAIVHSSQERYGFSNYKTHLKQLFAWQNIQTDILWHKYSIEKSETDPRFCAMLMPGHTDDQSTRNRSLPHIKYQFLLPFYNVNPYYLHLQKCSDERFMFLFTPFLSQNRSKPLLKPLKDRKEWGKYLQLEKSFEPSSIGKGTFLQDSQNKSRDQMKEVVFSKSLKKQEYIFSNVFEGVTLSSGIKYTGRFCLQNVKSVRSGKEIPFLSSSNRMRAVTSSKEDVEKELLHFVSQNLTLREGNCILVNRMNVFRPFYSTKEGKIRNKKRNGILQGGALKRRELAFLQNKKETLFYKVKKTKKRSQERRYKLQEYRRSNQATCLHQYPAIEEGSWVERGDLLANCSASAYGELALGKNVLLAYMPWEGYNFEDAILISNRLVNDDVYTSIHIERYEVHVKDTEHGVEQITANIPGNLDQLAHLDEDGLAKIGSWVCEGDVLVGKTTPVEKEVVSPYQKLLYSILERPEPTIRETSLRVPKGVQGRVISHEIFEEEEDLSSECFGFTSQLQGFGEMFEGADVFGNSVAGQMHDKGVEGGSGAFEGAYIPDSEASIKRNEIINPKTEREDVEQGTNLFQPSSFQSRTEKRRKIKGVHIYIVEKRKIQVGDKLSGRHGNKGIVSRILPEQDMPYLPDGTSVDVLLNPLGVPSRMNVGQIFECLLGLAAGWLGDRFKITPFDEIYGSEASRSLVYLKLYQARLKTGQKWLFNPRFPGKVKVFDGRNGDRFDQAITIGRGYILKLVHMVEEKIHARSTGPYSLVTQQPVRGRSKKGGQRVGEMEVWALEGFGAAYTLQELLTVKSDDVKGRRDFFDALLRRKPIPFQTPESFKLLVRELQCLCLDVGIYVSAGALNTTKVDIMDLP